MRTKPWTLRQAVIVTTALSLGSTAGAVAEQAATRFGFTHPGPGQLAAAVTTLWILGRLDALIDERR
ncbi:hypothetical protein GCM10009827_034350 [Dactylosporangium maewongense]|uniref:Uncharacterized protein n=1 Tax=Dactylosporangium maewongense TaxID=634393 RepID=A0ABN2ADY7_9ACTN